MKEYILTVNNLEFELTENKNRLKIIGKNNHIKINRNEGKIQIVGLNCNVTVIENYGTVEVIGACETIDIDASCGVMVLDSDHVVIGPSASSSYERMSAGIGDFSQRENHETVSQNKCPSMLMT